MSISTPKSDFRNRLTRPKSLVGDQRQIEALQREVVGARTREELLLKELREQSEHHELLAQELEHRLANGLQLISSLLSSQARATGSPEAAAQLTIASRRVAALGRVHHRLHQLDNQDHVAFSPFLQDLCRDLSNLLFDGRPDFTVDVEATSADLPGRLAIPLGFIVSELITNAAKYARGKIGVRFKKVTAGYCLSVLDDGPGLPPGFDPCKSKGLGMKIVMAQAKQIGGDLHMSPGDDGRGARFTVRFEAPTVLNLTSLEA
jgi:two-component sensor histidine kinase